MRRRPAVGRVGRKWLEIGLYIAPAVVLYVVFIIVPVIQAVHYSFYDWDGLGPLTDLHRARQLPRGVRGSAAFRQAMAHNAILVALSLGIQLPLALGVALLLNRPMRGRSVLRLVFFAPYVLSEAITAIVFLQILQPGGLVDAALKAVGLGGLVQLWLADLGLVFYTLFVVITWKYIGFAIILFLAGLQGIPQRAARGGGDRRRNELDEAALHHAAAARADDPHLGVPRDHRVDPALRPRLDHDRSADPRARRRRWRPTWSTRACNSLRIGYATAVAVILFFICFVFSILYQIFVLRRDIVGQDEQDGRLTSTTAARAPALGAVLERAGLRHRAGARRRR